MNKNSKVLYTGDQVLDVMSACAVNRNNYIEELIRNAFHLDALQVKKNILDFGAGKGEFINRFSGLPNLETHAVEIEESYRDRLSKNNHVHKDIEEIEGNTLDFIYSIDVLEHIKDDGKVLKQLHEKLREGGILFIYVPARIELYSNFDKKIGHVRRYHKKELFRKVCEAQLKVNTIRYHEFIGYFAAYYNKFISRDGTLNPKAVSFHDTFFVPVTNMIERHINMPIGKSLYVIASK